MSDQFFRQVQVGHHAVFAYLIGDLRSGEAIVVDPADDVDELIGLADLNNLKITEIINTHGHVDHIMGNAEMQEKTGARIKIHEAEAGYLDKIGDYWLEMFNARKSPPADEVLRDGYILRVGDFEWLVLHTPGHTPGGICLYHPEQGICLTGDTLFVGSVGRIDGPRSSGPRMLDSIKEKLLVLPDHTRVFPGHHYGPSPVSTIGRERIANPFLNGKFRIDI